MTAQRRLQPARRAALLALACVLAPAFAQPRKPPATSPASASAAASHPASAAEAKPTRLDINTASAKELEKLPKMTPAIARAIVDNAPYKDVRELSDRGIVTSGVYNAIRNRIEVRKP